MFDIAAVDHEVEVIVDLRAVPVFDIADIALVSEQNRATPSAPFDVLKTGFVFGTDIAVPVVTRLPSSDQSVRRRPPGDRPDDLFDRCLDLVEDRVSNDGDRRKSTRDQALGFVDGDDVFRDGSHDSSIFAENRPVLKPKKTFEKLQK